MWLVTGCGLRMYNIDSQLCHFLKCFYINYFIYLPHLLHDRGIINPTDGPRMSSTSGGTEVTPNPVLVPKGK